MSTWIETVNAFESSSAAGAWPNLSRKLVADRLREIVICPDSLRKDPFDFSGVLSALWCWAHRDPSGLCIFATELFENGSADLTAETIAPSSGLRSCMWPCDHPEYPQADWMIFSSLQDHFAILGFAGDPSGNSELRLDEMRELLSCLGIYKTLSVPTSPSSAASDVRQMVLGFDPLGNKDPLHHNKDMFVYIWEGPSLVPTDLRSYPFYALADAPTEKTGLLCFPVGWDDGVSEADFAEWPTSQFCDIFQGAIIAEPTTTYESNIGATADACPCTRETSFEVMFDPVDSNKVTIAWNQSDILIQSYLVSHRSSLDVNADFDDNHYNPLLLAAPRPSNQPFTHTHVIAGSVPEVLWLGVHRFGYQRSNRSNWQPSPDFLFVIHPKTQAWRVIRPTDPEVTRTPPCVSETQVWRAQSGLQPSAFAELPGGECECSVPELIYHSVSDGKHRNVVLSTPFTPNRPGYVFVAYSHPMAKVSASIVSVFGETLLDIPLQAIDSQQEYWGTFAMPAGDDQVRLCFDGESSLQMYEERGFVGPNDSFDPSQVGSMLNPTPAQFSISGGPRYAIFPYEPGPDNSDRIQIAEPQYVSSDSYEPDDSFDKAHPVTLQTLFSDGDGSWTDTTAPLETCTLNTATDADYFQVNFVLTSAQKAIDQAIPTGADSKVLIDGMGLQVTAFASRLRLTFETLHNASIDVSLFTSAEAQTAFGGADICKIEVLRPYEVFTDGRLFVKVFDSQFAAQGGVTYTPSFECIPAYTRMAFTGISDEFSTSARRIILRRLLRYFDLPNPPQPWQNSLDLQDQIELVNKFCLDVANIRGLLTSDAALLKRRVDQLRSQSQSLFAKTTGARLTAV